MSQNSMAANGGRKRGRSPRWRWVIGTLIVALAVGAFWMIKSKRKSAEESPIKTADVERGSLTQTIVSTGTIAAETGANVKIGSQITGRIRRLNTDLGQKVQAGQIIAELDAPDLRANLESAQRNLAQAQARYQQQLAGVSMQHTQVAGAFEQASESVHRAQAQREQAAAGLVAARSRVRSAEAALAGAQARLKSAQANLRSAEAAAKLQPAQTSAEVTRAQAGLSTAQAALVQAQKGADLQVHNAETAVSQAQSNADLAAANLKRAQSLLEKGYVSQQDVDAAQNQYEVARQGLAASRNSLDLTRQKVAADLQSAQDAVTQAQATLAAAQAGTYQDVVRTEAVNAAQSSVVDAESSVAQAQSQLESAREDVRTAQAQLVSAEADVRSAKAAQSVALGNMTEDRLKQKDVQAAYEAQRQAQAQVAYQMAQYDKSNIRSPISGTVISLTQQEGETVAAGLSAPTLVEVVDLARLEVHAFVDETDIAQVRLGQAAKVEVDAFPKETFTGKVTKISSAATVQDNVVTYQVTIGLDKYPEGLLKPQMTANVTLTLARKDNVLLVPNEALKQKKGVTQVVVLKDGKGEVRDVKTGMTDGTNTEITEGLQEGEKVVLAGFMELGLEEFASTGRLPGFFSRGPLGTGGGNQRGGAAGARGGGAGGRR